METLTMLCTAFLSFPLLILAIKSILLFYKNRRFNLPPSPPSFPVTGHLHLLKPPAHRTLSSLAKQHGPIVSLRFGSRLAVLVSSSSMAHECFNGQNDAVLSNRPFFLAAKYIGYNYTTMGSAPYGDHWRNLRKISALEILSSNRLSNFLWIRKDEIRRMIKRLSYGAGNGFAKVELRSLLTDLTFNNIMRMVAGKRYYGDEVHNEEEARAFKELVVDIAENSGANHAGDYFPILKLLGNKYERKIKELAKRMDEFLQGLVNECRSQKDGNTMINHLLGLQETQPEYYTDETIKGLMLAMLSAGTDTSAVTLEWAMSNLLNHPHVLQRAQAEIESKIGSNRLIDESDISELPYLQNIVSETLRLYPAAPLLVPRLASEDIKIGGYDVPRGTILLVNAWAIHREPGSWSDPECFKPERFEGSESEAHKLMPFGLGRRACPGSGLAQRITALALGSLIQCFDWERVDGQEVDMSEGPGLSMRKVEPLQAMCRARAVVHNAVLVGESEN